MADAQVIREWLKKADEKATEHIRDVVKNSLMPLLSS